MNDLDNITYTKSLREIDQNKRMTRLNYNNKYQEESLEMMHFQAALIRLVLFYYIDQEPEQEIQITSICRHSEFRWKLERIAEELILFRENAPEEAARVLGIDACAQEIGCRPEVFAPVFRRLTGHVVVSSIFHNNVKQWKITYHVGEDFMDFVDGLRAVDEAVLFFNMKNGDRLGHATVLGLNVKKWYYKKQKNICLPLQDYLDNVVWLYQKLNEFNIKDCESLKGFLHSEYEKNFRILYEEHMTGERYHSIGIDTYFEAWS